jgi:hypothetical protein
MSLQSGWDNVLDGLDDESTCVLVDRLNRRGHLDRVKDRVVAQAGEELRADVAGETTTRTGKLGQAVALIEAGAAKDVVLAKVSRRTYFRARRQWECQECQRHNEPSVTVSVHGRTS